MCSQRKILFWSTDSKACERRLSSDDIHEFQSQWSGLWYPWPSETKAIQALTVISLLSLSTLQWALEIHSLGPTGPDLFISEPLSFSISSEEITQTQVFHFSLPFITISLDVTGYDCWICIHIKQDQMYSYVFVKPISAWFMQSRLKMFTWFFCLFH